MISCGRIFRILCLLLILLAGVVLLALQVGAVTVPLGLLPRILAGGGEETTRAVLLTLRLPRVLMAGIVGAALSLSGAVFQALLGNPLAEPYLLGVSSGSALGAILALMAGLRAGGFLPFAAFAGGLLTVLLVYLLGRREGRLEPSTLLLTGVMISAFFGAAILFLLSVASPYELGGILSWMMGDLSRADMATVRVAAIYCGGGTLLLLPRFREMNLLSLGEETALNLGVRVDRLKVLLFVTASLMTGISVAFSGLIGFVGLLVPHVARLLFGGDHRLLLPVSILLGAALLILSDTLARAMIAPAELPVGVITAFLGAPLFVVLLKRQGGRR